MSERRSPVVVLLTVIAVAVVVIAGVLVYTLIVKSEPDRERQRARTHFEIEVQDDCFDVGPDIDKLTVCEGQQRRDVERMLQEWEEAGRPELDN